MESQTLNMFLSFVGYTPGGGEVIDPGSVLFYTASTGDLISGLGILASAIIFCIAMFALCLSFRHIRQVAHATSQSRAINRANNKKTKKSALVMLVSIIAVIVCGFVFANSMSRAYAIYNGALVEPGLIYSENVQSVVHTDTAQIDTETGYIMNSSQRDFSLDEITVDLTDEGSQIPDLQNTKLKINTDKGNIRRVWIYGY